MNVLALDSCGAACSVALRRNAPAGPLFYRHKPMTRGHAEALLPMVQDVMAEAALGYRDVDRIVITRGPGSFAGVRVGLAAARGLALAHSLPLVGLTSFEAVLAGHRAYYGSGDKDKDKDKGAKNKGKGEESIMVVLDAPRGNVYGQLFPGNYFKPGGAAAIPFTASPKEVARSLQRGTILAGSGVARLQAALVDSEMGEHIIISDAPGAPDARLMVSSCLAQQPAEAFPEPLYLRPPDARLPKNSEWRKGS